MQRDAAGGVDAGRARGERAGARLNAVVIGSGVGGLTSAILLAKAGWRVTVLERHTRAGGCLHRFFREGVGYDTGFHYVGSARPDQPMGRMLRHLGVYDALAWRELDPDGFDRVHFPGLEVAIPRGLDRWLERLGALFPHERAGLAAYGDAHRAAVRAYGWYTLDLSVPPEAILPWEERTVQAVLDATVRDPRAQRLLASQAALYGVPPAEAPFGLHAVVTDHFLGGAWTIAGGGDRLALAMVRQLRALGGQVQFRAEADGIEAEGGHVTAVRVGERRFPADLVIANVHPKVLLPMLPAGAVRPAWRTRVESLVPGRAHLGVYLRVRGDLSGLARRNLYRFADWDADHASRPATPDDVPFWFATGPGAEVGGDVVLGLAQADWGEVTRRREAGEAEYRRYKDALVGAVVGSMLADHPGWEVVRVEGSTPLTTWRFLGSPSGATYGHYHSVGQMGRYRIGSHTRLRGLALVGQSVAFPGICGAVMSAYMTCGEVLGAERLVGELPA